MADNPAGESCGSCRFFATRGVCRRYPPTLLPGQGALFPAVSSDDWCGEYRGESGEVGDQRFAR